MKHFAARRMGSVTRYAILRRIRYGGALAAALASIPLLLASALPSLAAGGTCPQADLGAVPPPPVDNVQIRPYRSISNATTPATQENCVFLEAVGTTPSSLHVDHYIADANSGLIGPWTLVSATAVNISTGDPVTCTMSGNVARTAPSSGSLPIGSITDICCFVWQASSPGTCSELPADGDFVHHTLSNGSEVDMPLFDYGDGVGGTTCGLVGLEMLAAVALARRLRRRGRRRARDRARHASAARWTRGLLVVFALLAVADARDAHAQVQADVLLSVDASSGVTATLRSLSDDVEAVPVSGTVLAHVVFEEHPLYGRVASSVEIVSSDLTLGDMAWSLSSSLETLSGSLSNGGVSIASTPIPGVANAAHTATLATSDLVVLLDDGELAASGMVLDDGVLASRFLDADPRVVRLAPTASVETVPSAGGQTQVALHIPIDERVPVDPPRLVSWLTIEGELVLSGAAPAPAPLLPHPWLLGAVLLGAAVIALQRGARRV
jgi:hypothetical protein